MGFLRKTLPAIQLHIKQEGTEGAERKKKQMQLHRGLSLQCVEERVNIADLRLLSLERPACKVGPWPSSGNLNGEQLPTLI